MECNNKKGADAATSTPRGTKYPPNKQFNFNRFNRICLCIQTIALVGFLWCYHKQAENALYLWGGVLGTASIIHALCYPIEEDDNDI